MGRMSEETPSDVLGALPHSRPHRRSDKRGARPAANVAEPQAAAAKPKAPAAPKPKPTAAAEPKAAKPKPKVTAAKPATRTKAGAAPKASAAIKTGQRPRLQQPAQPQGTPSRSPVKRPAPKRAGTSERHDILGTAVQAAAELAEIGLTAGARAIRHAVSRLPRP